MTHYYREPYPYVRQKVAVIGAQELRRQGGAGLLSARRGGHARSFGRRRCPTRSSTGSSRTSRTGSRKAASARSSTRRVEEIRESSIVLRTPDGRMRDRERLGARDDRLPSGLRLSRSAADRRLRTTLLARRCSTTRPSRRAVAGRLPCGHGVRRISDRPLVHRERPLSRAADRQAHRARRPPSGCAFEPIHWKTEE